MHRRLLGTALKKIFGIILGTESYLNYAHHMKVPYVQKTT